MKFLDVSRNDISLEGWMPLTGAVQGSPSLETVRVNHSNLRVKQLKGTLK